MQKSSGNCSHLIRLHTIKTEDPQSISQVLRLHQAILDQHEIEDQLDEDHTQIMGFTITYRLNNDKEIIRVPVIVLIVALIGAWGICVPLLIVGLFLSCRYSFDGKDDLAGFNNAMDKAGQTAENIKNEFR